MSFTNPDLVIQSIILDGIENMKADPDVLDDVFGQFGNPYAAQRYGVAEIQKIKDLLTGVDPTEIAVVHSFHEAQARTPCYAIQLGHTVEDKALTKIDDFEEDFCEPLDAAELALLVKETGIIPTSYNPLTGRVQVPDSVDLSQVYPNFIFEDGSAVEHVIRPGLSDVLGDKFFFVGKQATVDIVNPGLIKSFLTQKALEVRGVTHNVDIIIGVFSKEALLTKYLFVLLQFILLSRKADMISRCFYLSSLSGSDFNRDTVYQGDSTFSRFLTISGRIDHSWRSDQVVLIDSAELDATPIEGTSP